MGIYGTIEDVLAPAFSNLPEALATLKERLHETDTFKWQWLGYGSYAKVFWLGDRTKVLKVTTDTDDAEASKIVQQKPASCLVHVYDVFKMAPAKKKNLYFIVVEKLTPLSAKEENLLYRIQEVYFDTEIPIAPIQSVLEDFMRAWKHPADHREEMIGPAMARHKLTYDNSIKILWAWAETLNARHIVWKDFKSNNILMRGREMVIADLGYSDAPFTKIPIIPVRE